MNIDILAAPQFHNCRIDAPRGIHNSGGGMSVLIDSIRACLMDRYAIRLCKEFTMNRLAKQIVTHPATEHRLEIFAESIDLINQWTDPFLEADAIVGAQFYYSNPLLFMPITGDMKRHASLYGDHLYLLNTEDWGLVAPTHPVFATNQNFIEHIGPITDFYEHDPDKLLEYHMAHGLYLIGISESYGQKI